MNLLEELRTKLGFEPFHKVDPNSNKFEWEEHLSSTQAMGQFVVTAVLTAMYQLSRTEEGFNYLVNRDKHIPWGVQLFGDDAESVVRNIREFTGEPDSVINSSIDEAGNEAMNIAQGHLSEHFDYESFTKYIDECRRDLQLFLPPELHLGKLLNDNSIDDRTHKMEGPVSGMMHQIEKMFAEPQGPDKSDNF